MDVTDYGPWFERFVGATGFLERYPLYAAVLARLVPIDTRAIPVMAVTHARGRFLLLYNDEWFRQQPQFMPGILLHEVHHIVLGHVTEAKFRNAARPELMELAMEVSANEHIREPLPPHLCWQEFRELGLRAGQSTLERYQMLCERAPLSTSYLAAKRPWLDQHEPWVTAAASPFASAALRALLGELPSRPKPLDPEDLFGPISGRRSRPRGPDPNSIAGRDPADLLEQLRSPGVLRDPVVDWRTELRRFARRGRSRCWSKPNRRFPDRIGQMPGFERRADGGPRPRLQVVLDTSASITAQLLDDIAAELRHLARHAEIAIVECDDEVQRVYPFRGELSAVRGRGGTDLTPPFAPELLRRHARDGLVYFTDGCGPWPSTTPPVRVLWVLTEGAPGFGCPFGRQVRMDGARPAGKRTGASGPHYDIPF